jgi:fumarate reductase subunit C
MMETRLYLLQRATALLMVPLVVGHLAVMIWAVRGGLSAAEILGRTQGSVLAAGFYGLFVLAVAVHAPIGLRSILREWGGWPEPLLSTTSAAVGIVLAVLGLRAVWAVVA